MHIPQFVHNILIVSEWVINLCILQNGKVGAELFQKQWIKDNSIKIKSNICSEDTF
jgi:hypothetical protein